ncbi:MAG TPA: hypothetical protein VFW45_07160 [Candidatus Polarisedimenticolia bacterium]|nr:hypothetical protein [Candidatus Polarisedimenticolia bacterium]
MEERDDDGALLKVAQAISDGHPVDWDSETTAQKDSAPELSHLKAMAALAEAHRRSRPARLPDNFDDTVPLRPPAARRAGALLRPALYGLGLLLLLAALRKLLH